MSIVVANKENNPLKKTYSAINSSFLLKTLFLVIDKNDSKQLIINMRIAKAKIPSIAVPAFSFNTCKDVRIKKQIPKRLADELKI